MITALKAFEQIGDAGNQLMCLVYLMIAHRRLRNAEEVSRYADRSLPLAASRQVDTYIGVTEANLGWLEWRAGKVNQAVVRCEAALAHMSATYPFQWTALLPLLAVSLDRPPIETAMSYARALVDPVQQLLPDPIEPLVKQAIRAWEQHDPVAAQQCLADAIGRALLLGYL
jgi:hypothetical protein